MFCWGSSAHGELGLGGIEDEQIFTPIASTWSEASGVTSVACGENHSLLVTNDGKIFSCGNNDHGQLGHDKPRKRPQLVSTLDAYHMTLASCGVTHSLAVNDWGQTFSWGSNSHGQLGLSAGQPQQPTPKIVRALATQQVVQIACGSYHSLALMSNGDLYSWGANSFGQLGLGTFSVQEDMPTLVSSLAGVPFAYIACGGYHTFALSKSGAVYGWGKNTCGQLGLNDGENRCYPSHLKSLRSIKICQISCGEEFTVFLTLDGGVFTCGAGRYGQLGHGDQKDEMLPRKVMELMGSAVVQATCGRRHLVVVSGGGRVQACGLAASGQLGTACPYISYVTLPRIVNASWMTNGNEKYLWRVFAGGDRCFATLTSTSENPYDSRQPKASLQILTINSQKLTPCLEFAEADRVDQDTLCYLETVFKSLASLNASFLTEDNLHYCCNSKNSGVDRSLAEEAFNIISRLENTTIKDVILQSVTGSGGLLESLKPSPPDAEALRCLLTLPFYHEMSNPKTWIQLQTPFAAAIARLRPPSHKLLAAWCHSMSRSYFERFIDIFKNVVCYYLKCPGVAEAKRIDYDTRIVHILNALESLNNINNSNPAPGKAPPEIFYIHELGEMIDVRNDYIYFLTDGQSAFYLCNYPFLLDAHCKTSLLEVDQEIQMRSAMNQAVTRAITNLLFQGVANPTDQQFVTLSVSREHIVADTLRELAQYGTSDLKKPLKVKFHGEEAEDAGGVRKEFFMLLLREILDPKYGMFRLYPDTRCVWFSEDSFEEEDMYRLIGVICGLAIYNFTIINVPFPLALYKKLLSVPVILEDLAELSPVLKNSLQSLLDYDRNDVEDVFCLTFELSREVFGEVRNHSLKTDGGNIAVTKENKAEYVDLYLDFIFNKSIEKKFNAFNEGFYKVCGGRVLKLFQPHELMAVVVGNEEYDWEALEATAEYQGGYSTADPAIRSFWEVFQDLTSQEKKNFLLFLTGSDRIPIQGMKAIKITIQPTSDDRFLPVAHTCFNLLDLPRYSTKEKLKYKLLQAIQQTEGFSLV